ncbi:hypothetical protein ACQVP2_02485 [Methylobacterium aquaticum]|uniref:hypothetical protein n=1 Tax=Methylobacterium aquaticum TaxID=270351 RepID=UPI003D173020
MVLVLDGIVGPDEVAHLTDRIRHGPDPDAAAAHLGGAVRAGLAAHPLFSAAVQPKHLGDVVLHGLTAGDSAPPLSDEAALRSDVALTVFLTPPEEYEGGDLVLDTGYGEEHYRGPVGRAVAYPTGALARRAEVRRGACWTADILVESRIRDGAQRDILYAIASSEQYLGLFAAGAVADRARLRRCRERLSRMWCER